MRNQSERRKRAPQPKGPAAAGAVTRVRRPLRAPARRQREFEHEYETGFAFS
jgi:hypothetical protein